MARAVPPDAERAATSGVGRGVVGQRMLAFVVDTAVVVASVAAVVRRLVTPGGRRVAATAAVAAVAGLLYHVVLEGAFGRTAGKKLCGIVVVREDGAPCSYAAAGVRTLLRFVDWLPAAYLVGLLAIALTDRDQRLGDLAAGTVVVRA